MPQRSYPQLSQNPVERVLGEMAVTVVKLARDVQDIERFDDQQPLYPCIRVLSASRTMVRYDHIIEMDASGGNRIITLPLVAKAKSWGLWVKKTDSSTNTVTITPQAGETIEGGSTYVVREQSETVLCICDGTQWYIYALSRPVDYKRVVVFTVDGAVTATAGALRIYNPFGRTATIIEVMCSADTGPTGQDMIIDVHKSGTTIFTDQTKRPKILDGANTGNSTDIDVPAWADNEYLTVDVDQVGSGVAGSNLTTHIVCRF